MPLLSTLSETRLPHHQHAHSFPDYVPPIPDRGLKPQTNASYHAPTLDQVFAANLSTSTKAEVTKAAVSSPLPDSNAAAAEASVPVSMPPAAAIAESGSSLSALTPVLEEDEVSAVAITIVEPVAPVTADVASSAEAPVPTITAAPISYSGAVVAGLDSAPAAAVVKANVGDAITAAVQMDAAARGPVQMSFQPTDYEEDEDYNEDVRLAWELAQEELSRMYGLFHLLMAICTLMHIHT